MVMAAARKARPPSYEQTMERLGRAPDHGLDANGELSQQPPNNDASPERVDDPRYERFIRHSATSDGGDERRNERGDIAGPGTISDGRGGEQRNGRGDVTSPGSPATISHSAVSPRTLHVATVHMPTDTQISTAASASPPTRHYTKKKDSRIASRSPTDNGKDFAGVQRQESTSAAGGSPTSPGEELKPWTPMETYVGEDGRTYIRDTSIVVVEHGDHAKRNLEIVEKRPSHPQNYGWFTIVGTICCVVIGAYAFKKSREVDKKFLDEDFKGAQEASNAARKWASVAFCTGALIVVVFIFLLFVEPCPLSRALLYDHLCPRGT